ncbi:hypothetical protein LG634_26985 [Streptomyces bambusae]|uniref:hypothetical protein n=1 Tax=Streptomyces bambusae TaxID=1550616 RepID=UPI001CFCD1CC|nr:hypothetical protein [Streptomyces bambusae]MCB5168455.1 hypothetical protein [Streptomyces bambusae]
MKTSEDTSENTPPPPPAPDAAEKPGWDVVLGLFGAACAVLRYGSAWSWWALLWVPLMAVGVGATVYEWRLLARGRRRMGGPVAWLLLVLAHAGLAVAVIRLWQAEA